MTKNRCTAELEDPRFQHLVHEISQFLFRTNFLHRVKQGCFLDSPYLQKGRNHKK